MSELQLLDRPPPDSRIRVEQHGDGVQITVPLREFRTNLAAIVLGLVCTTLAMSLFGMGWMVRDADERTVVEGFLVFYGLVFLAILAIALDMAGRRAMFVVAGDDLLIRRQGLLWARTWRWQRKKLRWITAYQGLQMIGVDSFDKIRTRTLFANEPADVLSWLAQVLRDAIPLQPESSPAPGEIEVSLADHPDKIPGNGFLFARPGRLAVRHAYLVGYQYEFFPATSVDVRSLWRMYRGTGRPVAPEQLQCKIADDGTACMQIIRTDWPTVWLTVWCDDKTAMQSALARFWGNESRE